MNILFYVLMFVILSISAGVACFWWRRQYAPNPACKNPARFLKPQSWSDQEVTIGWVGHSTVLINFYGTTILTDPVWSDKAGIHLGFNWTIGPKRHTRPALKMEDLGKVDLIILSHAHLDHFDVPTLKKLVHPETVVITPENTSRLLRSMAFSHVLELSAGQSTNPLPDKDLMVRAIPVRHWGNRYPWNRKYCYQGYLLSKKDTCLFFAGDTAYTPEFARLRQWGKIDVAFIPIGAYEPAQLQRAHCTPEQAWQMFRDMGAEKLVPIHWDTFVLSFEPVDEPLKRLLKAAGKERDRIVIREHGQTCCFTKQFSETLV